MLAYTAAYGAMIQLHRMFGSNDAGSYKRCLAAARGAMRVVRLVENIQPQYLHMTLGVSRLPLSGWSCSPSFANGNTAVHRSFGLPLLKSSQSNMSVYGGESHRPYWKKLRWN